jgi:hypothetical protein
MSNIQVLELPEIQVDYEEYYDDNNYWYYDDVTEKWIYDDSATSSTSTNSNKKTKTQKRNIYRQILKKKAAEKQEIQNNIATARSIKLNQRFGESFSRSKFELVKNEHIIVSTIVSKKQDKLTIPEVRNIDVRRM